MKNNSMKLKTSVVWITFVLLLCLGFFIRILLLDSVPASPDWDEVALGYNAYSILQTGRDEYGVLFPVVLQSFDDYKPALYAYLIIPFLKIFDLSVFAVRLPAVIFGTVSLAVVFFIIRAIFPKGVSTSKVQISRDLLALVSMFMLTIAPWHIQFSRVAFEAQVGLSFNLLFILFFLKGLKKPYYLVFSAFFAGLSMYVYQSEKVYIPLLGLLLVAAFYKDILTVSRKWLISAVFLGILIILPMAIYIVTTPDSLSRAKGVSVFSDTTKLLEKNRVKLEKNKETNNYIGMVMDNRRVEYVKAFTSGYLSHFEPNWLFYRGDSLRHQPPFMGLLYIFDLPFILIGLYVLLFSAIPRRIKVFMIGYILIAPIPASITIDIPHAVRTINVLPAPQILSALGLLFVFKKIAHQRKILQIVLYVGIILFIAFNITYYFMQYFVQMNYYYSKAWQYGWKEAVEYASTESEKFDQVIVTNVSPLDQSYMFFLFYTKYDPKKYLSEGGTKSGGFAAEHTAFEKYIFRPIDWNQDKQLTNTLFIGRPGDLPDNIGKTINYLDGEPAIIFSSRYE